MMMQTRTYYGRLCGTAAVALLSLCCAQQADADCKEYKIVEFEDRVEAVCVGEPPTEAQLQAQKAAEQEEQKRQDRESVKRMAEERDRQREEARAAKARTEVEAEGERKRRSTSPPLQKPGSAPNQINLMKF